MPLTFRPATPADHGRLEALVIDSFEPITWQKKLDAAVGPLNGRDWRARWEARLKHVFQTQVVLIGEENRVLRAMASGTVDRDSALGFIDILVVAVEAQGRGLGREMLRGMMEHLRALGCQYVHLDCLADNDVGNALYHSEGFQEVARHIRWFRKL